MAVLATEKALTRFPSGSKRSLENTEKASYYTRHFTNKKNQNLKPLTRLFKTNDGMSKIRTLEIIIEFKKHSYFASKTKMHINVLHEKWNQHKTKIYSMAFYSLSCTLCIIYPNCFSI